MTETRQLEIFKNWLQQHKTLLFKVVRAYAFSEEGREDLFQEISIQVWKSIPNFRKESAPATWLYRVALNTAIRWNQKEQKHENRQQDLADYEHVLEKKEEKADPRLDWLYKEINMLDEIDRSLCLLMLDGFSYREMSEIMGISESNVGVKIHRIKKYLIEKSEEYDRHGI